MKTKNKNGLMLEFDEIFKKYGAKSKLVKGTKGCTVGFKKHNK